MPLAGSKDRRIVVKKEATRGTKATSSGGRILRRTEFNANYVAEDVTSNEKRTDFAEFDHRQGTGRTEGSLTQELHNGGATEFFEALLMRDFTTVSAITAGVGSEFSLASGVFSQAGVNLITAGLRVGMVGRFTGLGSGNANNRNLLVAAIASDGSNATLVPVDKGAALGDVTSDSSATFTIPGKRTFLPTAGHVDMGLTIEDYILGTDAAEINIGQVPSGATIEMAPNGMVTVQFPLVGLDQEDVTGSSAPYFTSPSAAGEGRVFASTKGILRVNGQTVAIATGLTATLANGANVPAVIFNRTGPDVALGRALEVSGQFTAFLTDHGYKAAFRAEAEIAITLVLEAPAPANVAPEFIAIHMGRVKLGSPTKDDPDGLIVQTVPYRALQPLAANGVEVTPFMIQDSTLS